MARAKAKVQKSGGVGISLSLNALVGILLAIIGASMVFYNQNLSGTINTLSRIIGIFLICIGAIGVLHYFKYKQDGAVLVIGIAEILVGILLLIGPIAQFLCLIIAIVLILYGAYHLFRYHKTSWDFITGLAIVVVGILVLITQWVSEPIFLIIVGVAALIGAAYYLFIA